MSEGLYEPLEDYCHGCESLAARLTGAQAEIERLKYSIEIYQGCAKKAEKQEADLHILLGNQQARIAELEQIIESERCSYYSTTGDSPLCFKKPGAAQVLNRGHDE